jgi:hypothetical protein
MLSEYWSNLIEDIEDVSKTHTIIKLYTDIVKNDYGGYSFKDYNYYVILGYEYNNEIKETLDNFDILDTLPYPVNIQDFKDKIGSNEVEGEYECNVILKLYREDYSYSFNIEEIDFKLVRTLNQRERDDKLDKLFIDEDFWLFNLAK